MSNAADRSSKRMTKNITLDFLMKRMSLMTFKENFKWSSFKMEEIAGIYCTVNDGY